MAGIHADTSNLSKFTGAVEGILEAVDSGQYKTNFLTRVMTNLEKKFMAETTAAKDVRNLKHVFEWGSSAEESSNIPLFKLTKHGRGENRFMSYEFLPSTKEVPLPSKKYHIDPDITAGLQRAVFNLKAIVMETQPTITYGPKRAKALFIPDENSPKGFYTTKKTVTVQPGGMNSTGKFAAWWTWWFENSAQAHVAEITKLQTEVIAKTGQRIIRQIAGGAAGGQFTTGKVNSFGYSSAARTKAKQEMLVESHREAGEFY